MSCDHWDLQVSCGSTIYSEQSTASRVLAVSACLQNRFSTNHFYKLCCHIILCFIFNFDSCFDKLLPLRVSLIAVTDRLTYLLTLISFYVGSVWPVLGWKTGLVTGVRTARSAMSNDSVDTDASRSRNIWTRERVLRRLSTIYRLAFDLATDRHSCRPTENSSRSVILYIHRFLIFNVAYANLCTL